MDNWGFKKGFDQVKKGDIDKVKAEIYTALGINTRTQFYQRLNGNVELKISEAEKLKDIFAKYGITEIWNNA